MEESMFDTSGLSYEYLIKNLPKCKSKQVEDVVIHVAKTIFRSEIIKAVKYGNSLEKYTANYDQYAYNLIDKK